MNHHNKINKYLPTKKFTVITTGIFIVFMIIFFVSKWVSSKSLKIDNSQNSNQILAENTTLNDLVEKDTDGDGIPDWEEALWGLDPKNKNTNQGVSDFDWVKQKREELDLKTKNDKNKADSADQLNKTQKFAREFFTTITALKQSGNLDDTTINNLSQTLGGDITSPDLPELYKDSDISVSTSTSGEKYYSKLLDLFSKYQEKGLGDELDVASQFGDQSNLEKMDAIAKAYQGFASDVLKLKVPVSLSVYHIDIINNAANTGIAVSNLAKMQNDPVVGLAGLSQYQKYVLQFIKSAENLRDNLSSSDTINSN